MRFVLFNFECASKLLINLMGFNSRLNFENPVSEAVSSCVGIRGCYIC